MTSTFTRLAATLTLGFSLAVPLGAVAETYPERSISVVVPYSPGGGVDTVARLVATRMAGELGQSLVVDNKPGAGTNIGMAFVARANPDGYTLYAASNTLTTNKALFSKLTFDPANDFAAIGKIGEAPLVVVVNAESPYKTLHELIDAGRKQPDMLSYGTAGVGSSGHMASELLVRAGKFKALHVPYKGGSPAVTDLLANRLSFMAINPIEVVSHVQAGKLRALAVLNDEGTHLLPEVKTAKAQGVDVESTVWWGLVAPKATPEAVILTLNKALNTALNDPEIQENMKKRGAKEQPGTPAQFQSFIERETASLTQVIQDAGIKAD